MLFTSRDAHLADSCSASADGKHCRLRTMNRRSRSVNWRAILSRSKPFLRQSVFCHENTSDFSRRPAQLFGTPSRPSFSADLGIRKSFMRGPSSGSVERWGAHLLFAGKKALWAAAFNCHFTISTEARSADSDHISLVCRLGAGCPGYVDARSHRGSETASAFS